MIQMFLIVRDNVVVGRNVDNRNVFSFALAYFHSHSFNLFVKLPNILSGCFISTNTTRTYILIRNPCNRLSIC